MVLVSSRKDTFTHLCFTNYNDMEYTHMNMNRPPCMHSANRGTQTDNMFAKYHHIRCNSFHTKICTQLKLGDNVANDRDRDICSDLHGTQCSSSDWRPAFEATTNTIFCLFAFLMSFFSAHFRLKECYQCIAFVRCTNLGSIRPHTLKVFVAHMHIRIYRIIYGARTFVFLHIFFFPSTFTVSIICIECSQYIFEFDFLRILNTKTRANNRRNIYLRKYKSSKRTHSVEWNWRTICYHLSTMIGQNIKRMMGHFLFHAVIQFQFV